MVVLQTYRYLRDGKDGECGIGMEKVGRVRADDEETLHLTFQLALPPPPPPLGPVPPVTPTSCSAVRVMTASCDTAHSELSASPLKPKVDSEDRSLKSLILEVWYLRVRAWERQRRGNRSCHKCLCPALLTSLLMLPPPGKPSHIRRHLAALKAFSAAAVTPNGRTCDHPCPSACPLSVMLHAARVQCQYCTHVIPPPPTATPAYPPDSPLG